MYILQHHIKVTSNEIYNRIWFQESDFIECSDHMLSWSEIKINGYWVNVVPKPAKSVVSFTKWLAEKPLRRKAKKLDLYFLKNIDRQPFKYENELDMTLLLTNLPRIQERHQKLQTCLEFKSVTRSCYTFWRHSQHQKSIPQPQGRYHRHSLSVLPVNGNNIGKPVPKQWLLLNTCCQFVYDQFLEKNANLCFTSYLIIFSSSFIEM